MDVEKEKKLLRNMLFWDQRTNTMYLVAFISFVIYMFTKNFIFVAYGGAGMVVSCVTSAMFWINTKKLDTLLKEKESKNAKE